jgi:branched-chain amino acid transport system ATP-binding protein
MLEIDKLDVGYGGVPALRGVSLRVGEGELVAVVGPNGAGKSTLFNAVSGLVAATGGAIRFAGADLLRVPPARRAHLGIAHVPEGRQVFPSLSVHENIELGAQTKAGRAAWRRSVDNLYAWFPRLAERRGQLAGTLSGGEQQMLAIARALMSRPRLLLLDEPSLGLAPLVVKQIFEVIREINRQQHVTVFLVEQNAHHALRLADRGYVMQTGRIVLAGAGAELLANDEVRAAYLEGGA